MDGGLSSVVFWVSVVGVVRGSDARLSAPESFYFRSFCREAFLFYSIPEPSALRFPIPGLSHHDQLVVDTSALIPSVSERIASSSSAFVPSAFALSWFLSIL